MKSKKQTLANELVKSIIHPSNNPPKTEGTKQLYNILHPYCQKCGWRKGGVDSWNGRACKCGHSEPAIRRVS